MMNRVTSAARGSIRGRMMSAIAFTEFGVPSKVLKLDAAALATEPTEGFVCVAMKSSRVSAEDIRVVSGKSHVNRSTGVAGTTGVGSVVKSAAAGVAAGSNVFVVGSGTWSDHVTVSGDNAYPLPSKLSVDAAAQLDVVATACAIMQQNPVPAGGSVFVDIADEALHAALVGVAKHNSVKVGKAASDVNLIVTSATGPAFTLLCKQLAVGGTVVRLNNSVFETAGDIGVKSGVGAMIFSDKKIRGFDFHAMARSNPVQCGQAVAAAAALLADGKIALSKAGSFQQAEFAKSINAAQSGKCAIFTISK